MANQEGSLNNLDQRLSSIQEEMRIGFVRLEIATSTAGKKGVFAEMTNRDILTIIAGAALLGAGDIAQLLKLIGLATP